MTDTNRSKVYSLNENVQSKNSEEIRESYSCYSVFREHPEKRSGGDSEVVTPVPIPNTEVKHFSG